MKTVCILALLAIIVVSVAAQTEEDMSIKEMLHRYNKIKKFIPPVAEEEEAFKHSGKVMFVPGKTRRAEEENMSLKEIAKGYNKIKRFIPKFAEEEEAFNLKHYIAHNLISISEEEEQNPIFKNVREYNRFIRRVKNWQDPATEEEQAFMTLEEMYNRYKQSKTSTPSKQKITLVPTPTPEELVQKFFAAQMSNKLEEAPLAPTFKTWVFSDPVLPTGGFYDGVAGIKQLFEERIPSTMTVEHVDIKRNLVDGNSVMVLGYLTAKAINPKHPLKGQEIEEYFLMHFIVEGDKIVELRDYPSHHLVGSIPGAFDVVSTPLSGNYSKEKLVNVAKAFYTVVGSQTPETSVDTASSENIKAYVVGPGEFAVNGVYTGRNGLLDSLKNAKKEFETLSSKDHEYRVTDNIVTISGVSEEKVVKEGHADNGKTYLNYWVYILTIQDGKVVSFTNTWSLQEKSVSPNPFKN